MMATQVLIHYHIYQLAHIALDVSEHQSEILHVLLQVSCV